jgi:hypothetical protein
LTDVCWASRITRTLAPAFCRFTRSVVSVVSRISYMVTSIVLCALSTKL